MGSQVFDDGSRLDYDAAGNIVGGIDSSGAPISTPGVNGSAIIAQVVNLLGYGVRSAIDARYNATGQVSTAPAPNPAAQLPGLLLLALGALLVYKLAT
jgi:hypothetical protein